MLFPSGFHMPYPTVSTTVLGQDALPCLQMRMLSEVAEKSRYQCLPTRVFCMVQPGQSYQAWPWQNDYHLRAQGAPLSETGLSSLEGLKGQWDTEPCTAQLQPGWSITLNHLKKGHQPL